MRVFHFESKNKSDGKTIMLDTLLSKNVLVVGSGGREHAIVDALSRSRRVGKIFCAPGNAGIAAQAECLPLKETQIPELVEFAKEHGVDLTVVGPEVPLSAGISRPHRVQQGFRETADGEVRHPDRLLQDLRQLR